MTPGNEPLWERWEEVDRVFEAVLDRPPEDRERFLALTCAGDRELLRAVRVLLAHHATPGEPRAALSWIARAIFPSSRPRRSPP